MSLNTIALFGANGQVGRQVLLALIEHPQAFAVRCFVPPGTERGLPIYGGAKPAADVVFFDADKVTRAGLAAELRGVDAVVSALSGPALDSQPTIQDAAADAGVARFYPSEYGMHHIYRKPNDPLGYVHAMWDQKARLNEQVLLHPAVLEGKMSYTVIGCGDFYDQDREPTWCPWTQEDVGEYVLHGIGDLAAKADYTLIGDFAAYLAASLAEPAKSRNRHLNFKSDTVSLDDIADMLEKYSDRPVRKELIPVERMHAVVADPSAAAPELQTASPFPVDFWYLVKGAQGQGRFRRPDAEYHNDLFPGVGPTTFEDYFKGKFGDYRKRKRSTDDDYEPVAPATYDDDDKNYWTDKHTKVQS